MSSKFTDLWQLMSQYRFEVAPDSGNDDLVCILCKNLIVDACQTVCGCQYCHKCISDYLTEGDKYCPGGKDECKEEYLVMERDVIKNIRMNSRISKLSVRCPNELCQVKTELVKMADHLMICTMHNSVCPYASMGCDKLQNHKYNDPFLHSIILIDSINNLKNEANGLKEKFDIYERDNIAIQGKSRMEASELIEEIAKQRTEILELKVDLRDKSYRMTYLEKEINNKNNKILSLNEELTEMKMDLESKLSEISLNIDKTELDIVEMKEHYETMTSLIKSLSTGNNVSTSSLEFDYIWTMDKLSQRRKVSFSEAFYSHGYKLCLSVHILPHGFYLWCNVMSGANDDTVEWPIILTIDLCILNQKTLKAHIRDTFQYDTYNIHYKTAFERPNSVCNSHSIGSNTMITYSSIKDSALVIVKDSIMIGCSLRQ